MNRYWEALDRQASLHRSVGFEFRCPLQFTGITGDRAGRWNLALQKKLVYPSKIRAQVRSGIVHILDHSYAFLLEYIPSGVRTIVTVHDLLPLREPDGLGTNAVRRFRRRVEWVKKADLILADSQATADDLVELIGADRMKIRVLPLGAEPRSSELSEFIIPEKVTGPFIFSIGGYMKRKNLEILPAVIEKVRAVRPEIQLVRAGALLPDTLRKEFQERCGNGSLVELGKVTEAALDRLYGLAAATIIPSRYEGFGLPVLEAMARECPVVAARTTSLPEVGGDAASYFEVDSPDEAASRILDILLADPASLAEMKAHSLVRAGQFTWESHFCKLLEIYRELAAR